MRGGLRSVLEGASLRPESRAAIERAPGHALGIEYRVVTCTAAAAQDMLDYFRSTADVLTTLGDARAGACAVAVDNLRLALGLRGSSPRANTGSRSRSHSAPVMGHGPNLGSRHRCSRRPPRSMAALILQR